MAGVQDLLRHWMVEHDEARRRHVAWRAATARTYQAAYGYATPQPEHSGLNDSLLVAWLAAEDPRHPA